MFGETLSPLLKPSGVGIKIHRKRKRNEMPTATFAAVTGSLAPTFSLWRVSLCLKGCGAAAPESNASWFITATLIRELLLQITLPPEIWALPSHLVWLEKQPFSPPFTSQSLNTFFLPFSCLLLGSNDSKVCKRVAKWIFFFAFSETWCNLWIAE